MSTGEKAIQLTLLDVASQMVSFTRFANHLKVIIVVLYISQVKHIHDFMSITLFRGEYHTEIGVSVKQGRTPSWPLISV